MGVLSIREFNANVSKALARVEAGETIRLTKHGRPIARIEPEMKRPLPEPGTPEWQAAYDRMVALMNRGISLGGKKPTYEERTE